MIEHNLPEEYGNSSIKRIVAVYAKKFTSLYGFAPKILSWGLIGKQFKTLLNHYTEHQIALMILLHFEWRGSTGEDEFSHKRLESACFPIEWIQKNSNAYEAYLRNALEVDLDNPKVVEDYFNRQIKNI